MVVVALERALRGAMVIVALESTLLKAQNSQFRALNRNDLPTKALIFVIRH